MGLLPGVDPEALAVTGRGAWPDVGLRLNAAVGPCSTLTGAVAVEVAPVLSVTVTVAVKVPVDA
jgi:hypothetical protein